MYLYNFCSDTQLVSPVISSALACGNTSCEPVINSTEPVRIDLPHPEFQVRSAMYTVHLHILESQ